MHMLATVDGTFRFLASSDFLGACRYSISKVGDTGEPSVAFLLSQLADVEAILLLE